MRKPKKKEEKRGKQALIVNLVIAVIITFVVSIVLFDALKPDKIDRTYNTETNVKTQIQEIPRKETPKPTRKRNRQNQDYKKYQAHFEGKMSGIDEGEFEFDPDVGE